MKQAHGTPLMIALVAFASLTAISGVFFVLPDLLRTDNWRQE